MFENKFRDLLNRKPEIAEVMGSTSAMSEEERGLQLEKIGELKYLNHLLERLCWLAAPGKMVFDEYAKMLKEEYHASSQQGPTEIHGDLRTQPAARAGKVS